MAKRSHKMGKRGHRTSFPMKVSTVQCSNCKNTISKKQTKAVQIKTDKAFNLTKQFSQRMTSKTGQRNKRQPSIVVVDVIRVCRNGCQNG